MANYISKKDLGVLIRQAKKSKSLSPELCEVIRKIMIGLIDRNKFELWNSSKEDCVQDAIILISRKLKNIDPKANCFSYLTTCCFNLLRQTYRSEQMHYRTLDQLRNRLTKKSRKEHLRDRWVEEWEERATHV